MAQARHQCQRPVADGCISDEPLITDVMTEMIFPGHRPIPDRSVRSLLSPVCQRPRGQTRRNDMAEQVITSNGHLPSVETVERCTACGEPWAANAKFCLAC